MLLHLPCARPWLEDNVQSSRRSQGCFRAICENSMEIIDAKYYKKYAIILHDEEIIENN
jgi:hypothetical protein